MLPQLLRSLALSLALTLLLELSAAAVFGLRRPKALLLVALVNILTNPIVVLTLNLSLFFTGESPSWLLMAGLEIAAFLTEGFLYRNRLTWKYRDPFLLSLILNTISFFGGLLLS